ncbi:MAG: hypothetical protein HY286_17375 [Planctomycetes bacterium]|nr:hypothetical protein [Planctomycetota bacterium]
MLSKNSLKVILINSVICIAALLPASCTTEIKAPPRNDICQCGSREHDVLGCTGDCSKRGSKECENAKCTCAAQNE